jgi:hypothetical protein
LCTSTEQNIRVASGNDTVAAHDFTIGAVDAVEAQGRWIALNNWSSSHLQASLSGLEIEYRILQLYSRDRGKREASLTAVAGPGQQDREFGSTVPILFDCLASAQIKVQIRDSFSHEAARSSWAALHIYPSSDTNPVMILIDGKPGRGSRKSAQWCRAGVDACWQQKSLRIRPPEFQDAADAYDHARAAYDRILSETDL